MQITRIMLCGLLLRLLTVNIGDAQEEQDTFRIHLRAIQADTSRINEMVSYAKSILYIQPDVSWKYCQEAITLAGKTQFTYGLANALRLAGNYQADILGDQKKAKDFYNQAYKIYSQNQGHRYREGMGAILHSYGAMYQRMGDYTKAIENYIQATRILDQLGNNKILPRTYNNLASMYEFLKLFPKAEYYAREALKQSTALNDIQMISVTSVTLTDILIMQGKYEEVLVHARVADSLSRLRNDIYIQMLSNMNYGLYYSSFEKEHKKAIEYLRKSYAFSLQMQNPFEIGRAAANLAEQYLLDHQDAACAQMGSIALKNSEIANSRDLIQRLNYMFGLLYKQKADYKKSAEFFLQAALQKDSLLLETNQQQINFLEAQYQKERKEKEISILQSEKKYNNLLIKRRNILILSLASLLILLFIITWFILLFYRNKKNLSEKELQLEKQKLAEMEKQRQLEATLSVLKGEEAERSRMARDLHDGLGGLLSGVKLSLAHAKGNVALSNEGAAQFDKALTLLDTSMQELRRVAHNMMPEVLVKFGMKDALSDFCTSIAGSKSININFQFFGTDKRIDSAYEISIYRIAQELINNSIKHAGGTELLVQLILEESRVHLTVQDNGKGFDMSILNSRKGAGIINIRSRVESQHGVFEIMSQPDQGTEATVEFNW